MGTTASLDGRVPPNEAKYRAALARIEALFSNDPNAEELAASQKLLGPLYRTLDSRRSVAMPNQPRGIPLNLVVRCPLTQVKTLKHAWHVDGTWPLIGYDEAEKHRVCPEAYCVVRFLHISPHRHKDLVPNEAYERAKRAGAVLPCKPTHDNPAFVEKSADAIAAAYAARAAHRSHGKAEAHARRPSGAAQPEVVRPEAVRPASRRPSEADRTRRPSDADRTRPSDADRTRRPSDAGRTRRPSDPDRTRRPSDASRTRRPSDASRTRP